MYSNGNSFDGSSNFDANAGAAAVPIPGWSLLSVPRWKFGLRLSDDRGSI